MISRGVPARVPRPNHEVASKPGTPDSATVGTSGAEAMRLSFGDRDGAQLPVADVRNGGAGIDEAQRHAPGEQIRVAAAAADPCTGM